VHDFQPTISSDPVIVSA